eukprot:scaffold1430_cov257-Pinguiococcus_pyrenoidosus.AAC.5
MCILRRVSSQGAALYLQLHRRGVAVLDAHLEDAVLREGRRGYDTHSPLAWELGSLDGFVGPGKQAREAERLPRSPGRVTLGDLRWKPSWQRGAVPEAGAELVGFPSRLPTRAGGRSHAWSLCESLPLNPELLKGSNQSGNPGQCCRVAPGIVRAQLRLGAAPWLPDPDLFGRRKTAAGRRPTLRTTAPDCCFCRLPSADWRIPRAFQHFLPRLLRLLPLCTVCPVRCAVFVICIVQFIRSV